MKYSQKKKIDKQLEKCKSQFEILSCDTVKQMIRSVSSKSCSLVPVPTHILKTDYFDAIGSVITAIVNESLTSDEFLSALKQSLICPVLTEEARS